MREVTVIPFGKKPAACRRDEGGRQFSDPPVVVPVVRIATRRPGIRSRVALRWLIAGSGVRPTGRAGRNSGSANRLMARPVTVRFNPSDLPFGIRHPKSSPNQPTMA